MLEGRRFVGGGIIWDETKEVFTLFKWSYISKSNSSL